MRESQINKIKEAIFEEITKFPVHLEYEIVKDWIDYNVFNTTWSGYKQTYKKKLPYTHCRTTYGLKHLIEREYDSYVCNNAVKLAMMELGFELFPEDCLYDDGTVGRYNKDSFMTYYNMTNPSINMRWRRK